MAPRSRGLTSGEIALLRAVFGERLPYRELRLVHGPGANPLARIALLRPGNHAMTYLSTIHFNEGRFRDDFSAEGEAGALLVHEAVHVWQYSTLGLVRFALRYGRDFVGCGFDQARMYDYGGAPSFHDATLEGQAQMLADYHRLRGSPEGEMLEARLVGSGFHGL